MKVQKLLLIFLMLALTITLGSLGISAMEKETVVKITKIDFYVENIHPSYWEVDDQAKTRLHYNFFIYIENLKEVIEQISSVKIYDQHNNSWTIDPKEQVNLEKGILGGKERWYNNSYTDSSSMIAIKELKAVITLVDGTKVEKSFSIPEPGSLNCTKSYLYSEGYSGKISANHVSALKLAEITDARIKQGVLKVNFKVNDQRVSNGYLALLDKDQNYIGSSDWFTKEVSRETLSVLNKGKYFYVNNKLNTIQMLNPQLEFEEGKNLSDARYVMIYLYDGLQFDNTNNVGEFYHISISESKQIKF